MTRGHARFPVLDSNGNLQAGSQISVYEPTTTTLIADTIWNADDNNPAAAALGNPFITPDGNVSFFLSDPQRVDIGVTVPGQAQVIVAAVDVTEVGTSEIDLTFPGSGALSMQVGGSASATGAGSTALGQAASAIGTEATAVGQAASASGGSSTVTGQQAAATGLGASAYGQAAQATSTSTTALGQDSAATAVNSSAIGVSAVATGSGATALGQGASAANVSSTAVGIGAVTTEDQQVMLGTPSQGVDVPSFVTLPSIPSGIKFRVLVNDAGQLLTRYHWPVAAANLLTGVNATFNGSIGAWTGGTNATAAFTSTFSQSGTGALLLTQGAAGQSFAKSPAVAVSPGNIYVANIWEMQLASGTATEFEVWLAFFNSGGTIIGAASGGPQQAIVSGTWTPVDVRVQAPSGSATAELLAGVPSGGSAANVIYLDTAGIFLTPQVA
jgi:hypothetical protein